MSANAPVPRGPFLPTSILGWSLATASGADAGWVTPVAWAAWIAALMAFGIHRMNRMEL